MLHMQYETKSSQHKALQCDDISLPPLKDLNKQNTQRQDNSQKWAPIYVGQEQAKQLCKNLAEEKLTEPFTSKGGKVLPCLLRSSL